MCKFRSVSEEQDRTGQNRTEQGRTGQDTTKKGRTGHDRTGQNRLCGVPRSHQIMYEIMYALCTAAARALFQTASRLKSFFFLFKVFLRTACPGWGEICVGSFCARSAQFGRRRRRYRTEQDRTGQSRTERDRTGQNRKEQDRTGKNRIEQDRTGQNRTEQDRTEQGKTGQDRTGKGRTGHDRTGQNRLCDVEIVEF